MRIKYEDQYDILHIEFSKAMFHLDGLLSRSLLRGLFLRWAEECFFQKSIIQNATATGPKVTRRGINTEIMPISIFPI